ncbi:hypothetical protein [Limnobacter sp.]|jgi:hypothetical protein|uniref:hypothetical protein n=1 Tax=Limnobacter sp. TaxID=2003368 RepID=UPI000DB585FA|nr:MAG: hypothetical protein DCE87_14735 [Betaproteobacteria bacterium]PZO24868.1 MAG: hypothetical protein DCE89_04795 [Betaproteobacteria bacterium]PZO30890.1 MAG: hypothetical protein DCE88_04905 [Betaproteobacteria bacterium]
MQLSLQLALAFSLLFFGLLLIALSQQAHFRHRRWAGRCNAIGLKSVGSRRTAGIVALLLSATALAAIEGPAFGLVLWVMAVATLAVVLAWVLAPSR